MNLTITAALILAYCLCAAAVIGMALGGAA